ncbi:hypothetical protein AB0M44_24235 [Streptosporangium subroseum]
MPAWFDVSAPGTSRVRSFYQAMFDRPVDAVDETHALVDSDGSPAGLLSP